MRTKRSFLNFLTDAVPLLLVSILGIFKSKMFLQVLGDETLGLYQLFSQVMIYVGLVDGGLGSAILYYLYKPNASGDDKKMASILAGAKKIFSLIGAVVFTIAFVVSFLVPYMIKDNNFANYYVSTTFMLFAISSVISYFFIPYKSLLEVKERRYITNLVFEVGKVIQSILEIVLLFCGVKFEIILLMHSFIALVSNLLTMIITRKLYPNFDFNTNEKDYSFVKEIRHLIVHKINGMVSFNIDIILITTVLGLPAVAIYSSYNYVINMLKNLIYKISNALTAIVGNYMAKEKDKVYDLFTELLSLLYFIATVVCVPLAYALNGFISIFYEGDIATSTILVIAFVSYLFVAIIKLSINIFSTAGGLFKQTKVCTYFDMSINLALSLLLIYKVGISGVVIATTVSLIVADMIVKSYIVHRHVFHRNQKKYVISNIKFLLIAAADFLVGYLVIRNFTFQNIGQWFVIFTIFTVINALCISLIYYIIREFKFVKRLEYILKKPQAIEQK